MTFLHAAIFFLQGNWISVRKHKSDILWHYFTKWLRSDIIHIRQHNEVGELSGLYLPLRVPRTAPRSRFNLMLPWIKAFCVCLWFRYNWCFDGSASSMKCVKSMRWYVKLKWKIQDQIVKERKRTLNNPEFPRRGVTPCGGLTSYLRYYNLSIWCSM